MAQDNVLFIPLFISLLCLVSHFDAHLMALSLYINFGEVFLLHMLLVALKFTSSWSLC